MKPITLRLAFDGGWSDGDPGNGRLRFNAPALDRATYIYVNARDSQDAVLDDLIPTWGVGDALVIERAGLMVARVVAWVVGPIRHGGSYYKIPAHIKSASGSFAANDELTLHIDAKARLSPIADAHEKSLTLVAPIARDSQIAPENRAVATVAHADNELTPIALSNSGDELERLKTDNAYLLAVLERMVNDETPLYTADEI
jgi:hypothetical protein